MRQPPRESLASLEVGSDHSLDESDVQIRRVSLPLRHSVETFSALISSELARSIDYFPLLRVFLHPSMFRYLYKKHKAKKQASLAAVVQSGEGVGTANAGLAKPETEKKGDDDEEYPGVSQEEKKQAQLGARKYRWRLIAGLFFPYFIASTDVTSKHSTATYQVSFPNN